MSRIILVLFFTTFFNGLFSQEKAVLYSHHTFNGLAINPAYTGSHEMLSIYLSHRSQWIGFEGAPSFNTLGVHAPYKNTRMGLGLLVMNESMGLRKYTGIYANYAYRIILGRGKLALGLKGGIGTGRYEALNLGNEVVLSENDTRYMLPNFGVGIYYYLPKFYAGISVPILLGYKSGESGEIVAYHNVSNYTYYFTSGVKLSFAENWQVEPSVLIEYNKAIGIIADGGLGMLYKDVFRVGASYRNQQAIVMLLDLKLNYQLKVGVAYDFGLSDLNTYYRNSFEIALEYNFGYRIKAANPTIF